MKRPEKESTLAQFSAFVESTDPEMVKAYEKPPEAYLEDFKENAETLEAMMARVRKRMAERN